jgi:cytochrome c biogenesis protein CcdA/thiol-disulfide isomerase/thioredoxin
MRRLFLLCLVLVAVACSPAEPEPRQTTQVLTDYQALLERDVVAPGSVVRGVLRVPLPEGLHLQSNAPREAGLIPTTLTFAPPEGVDVRELVFPPSVDLDLPGYTLPLAVFEHEMILGVVLSIDPSRSPGRVMLPARLNYQGCDDRMCFRPLDLDVAWHFEVVAEADGLPPPAHQDLLARITFGTGSRPPIVDALPEAAAALTAAGPPDAASTLALFDQFEIRGTGAYMNTEEFLTFVRNAEAGIRPTGLLEGRGILAILAIVFLGGLALNLTPCVLPMIPINLAIIGAGSQGGNRRRGFVLGSVYGAAMAITYGLIGLVVILTAGTFGSINASPWFNAGIAALFVLLALAMFDVINIDFSRLSSRIRFSEQSRGTSMLAFGMGTVAALLAGACVAPVVIQVVVFAADRYATGAPAALALPFVLGLGMALPWPLAGAGISALPKPGQWMVRVKQVMGLFILGTAIYYGYVAYQGFDNLRVDPGSVSASVQEQLEAGWQSDLVAGLEEARRDDKPVLVDFWATWCKNCLVMDRTTLVDPAVVQALDGYVKIKVQAEDPDASPTRELLQRLRAPGLPAYAILHAR